ncbi:MAG: hypothetical protein SVR94_13805, partial [Pseudomonadota bacterium]|nr:hypothetical protein [Pseudomonadota bacterium]
TCPLTPTIMPSTPFSILNAGIESFTINDIQDHYGNALVADTQLKVTTTDGILGGTTELTLSDNLGRGLNDISFTLSSNPAQETAIGFVYPEATSATVTVSISSPNEQCEERTASVAGQINVSD